MTLRRTKRAELRTALLIIAGITLPFVLIALFGDVEPRSTDAKDSDTEPPAVRVAVIEQRIAAWATASIPEWKADMLALPAEYGEAAVEPLIGGLAHESRAVREASAHALGQLGAKAEPAVAALTRAFEDEDDFVRWKAARALGRIGPPAASALPLLLPAAEAQQETEIVRASAQKAVQLIRGE